MYRGILGLCIKYIVRIYMMGTAKNDRKALCKNRLIYDLALLNYEHVYNITYNLYIGYKNSVTEDAI